MKSNDFEEVRIAADNMTGQEWAEITIDIENSIVYVHHVPEKIWQQIANMKNAKVKSVDNTCTWAELPKVRFVAFKKY